MSKKMVMAALGAIIAIGLNTESIADNKDDTSSQSKNDMEKCYGIVKAGKNDCGSEAGACAGQTKVDNMKSAWILVPKGTCDKITGGSTVPKK